jgi:hypothetical protein
MIKGIYLIIAFAVAASVAGCAPSIVGANSRGGTIEHVSGLTKGDAFRQADAHCQKYNRVARISGQNEWDSSMTFDCVPP